LALASRNKTFLDVQASTIENWRPDIADQVTDAIPMIKIMKQHGSVMLGGGDKIFETLMHVENKTWQSYSGLDPMNLTPQNALTNAIYDYKDYAGSVVYAIDDIRRNRGPFAMKNLAKAKVKQLELSAKSDMNSALYLDGTGNDGKDLTGLANLVADSHTSTAGEIYRVTNAWWRNVSFAYDTINCVHYGAQQGGTLNTQSIRANEGMTTDNYSTTFLFMLDRFVEELSFGDTFPHFLAMTPAIYRRTKRAMVTNKRFTVANTMRADPGFRYVDFDGIYCVSDRAMPKTTYGTQTSAGRVYGINLDFTHLYIDNEDNFRPTEFMSLLPQQNADAMLMFFRGEFTVNKSNANGVMHSIHEGTD
jgi:hypothetical protein